MLLMEWTPIELQTYKVLSDPQTIFSKIQPASGTEILQNSKSSLLTQTPTGRHKLRKQYSCLCWAAFVELPLKQRKDDPESEAKSRWGSFWGGTALRSEVSCEQSAMNRGLLPAAMWSAQSWKWTLQPLSSLGWLQSSHWCLDTQTLCEIISTYFFVKFWGYCAMEW